VSWASPECAVIEVSPTCASRGRGRFHSQQELSEVEVLVGALEDEMDASEVDMLSSALLEDGEDEEVDMLSAALVDSGGAGGVVGPEPFFVAVDDEVAAAAPAAAPRRRGHEESDPVDDPENDPALANRCAPPAKVFPQKPSVARGLAPLWRSHRVVKRVPGAVALEAMAPVPN